MEQVLDLKTNLDLLPQYLELRNRYCSLLLTHPATFDQTRNWVRATSTEIRLIVDDGVVLGVVLLYFDRGGEVAFFSRNPARGIGTKLLQVLEKMAGEAGLATVWAWVREDNPVARRVFEKCGYVMSGSAPREYQAALVNGTTYIRYLTQ